MKGAATEPVPSFSASAGSGAGAAGVVVVVRSKRRNPPCTSAPFCAVRDVLATPLAAVYLSILAFLSPASSLFVRALDNGYALPPMGWSTWYGNRWLIDESLIRETADALVDSGLRDLGYRAVWIDDGFAVGRDPITKKLVVDEKLFPSGMRALGEYIHERGLLFGVYTSKGGQTCLGSSKHGPPRPGSCGHEQIDADTYAHDWKVDLLKNDGCGGCKQHGSKNPHEVMRDALNATGRPIYYAVHDTPYGTPRPDWANDWRTGVDLCCPWYELWLWLLDEATTDVHRERVGPGSFANPDFLQVGYSMNRERGKPDFPSMSLLERRSHYTLWAALPAPLVMGAELRPGKPWGGIYDPYTFETLTNPEVIAVNQDALAAPMKKVWEDGDDAEEDGGKGRVGLQVWVKPLAGETTPKKKEEKEKPDRFAVVLFHRTLVDVPKAREANEWHTPRPEPAAVHRISVSWETLGGYPPCAAFEVRDLWARRSLGVHCGEFGAGIEEREARIYVFERVDGRYVAGAEGECGCVPEPMRARAVSASALLEKGRVATGPLPESVVHVTIFLLGCVAAAFVSRHRSVNNKGGGGVNLFAYLPVRNEEKEGGRSA